MVARPSTFIGEYILHRATNLLTGQQVALKRVPSEVLATQSGTQLSRIVGGSTTAADGHSIGLRTALAREFQTQASLQHPHIVSVIDDGFDAEQRPYFAMELLESPQTILEASAGRSIHYRSSG